jgi:uncharacterized protein (TIGR00369 family)
VAFDTGRPPSRAGHGGAFPIGTIVSVARKGAMNCAPTMRLGGRWWAAGILGHMNYKSGFELRDADYQRRVRESFARQGLMAHLGAELVSLEPGGVAIRVPFRGELTQQHGFFHAGVTGAIADSACGYAAFTLMGAEDSVLTVEYKINLLAPADGEELVARARVVRSGKTLKVCMADVFARKGGVENHCATVLATIMCMAGKADRAK